MSIKSERTLHRQILQSIRRGELADVIVDKARLEDQDRRATSNQLPEFSIDHLSRLSAVKAGAAVMKALSNLESLTSDQNVSVTPGQVLKPDIVCVNPELQSLVIFELKKASQTGRQAVTELLAYEQEVKNLLPLLSNYDVNFVLISTEWSTLMDHAVASAIAWSGRKILCLDAALVDGNLQLQTRVPEAWRVTGSVDFPPDALASVTICLYEKNAYSGAKDREDSQGTETDLDPRIWTALELIAREGDRLGCHGFAVLWRDHLGLSLARYNITVCTVSPFAFYTSSRMRDIIRSDDGRLVAALDKFVRDYDPQGHSEALMATATAAHPILKEVSDPMLEGFSSWERDRLTLSRRAEPLLCEFWGALGDFARAYV